MLSLCSSIYSFLSNTMPWSPAIGRKCSGITNYGIAAAVYGQKAATVGRDLSYEMPDYEAVEKDMSSRKSMTLVVLWNRYAKRCRDSGLKFYSYRQFCENYAKWCEENKETLHFNAVIGQKMEVDFAGKTFQMVDHLTGEVLEIVVFVAVLPYSQYIYAEGIFCDLPSNIRYRILSEYRLVLVAK